MAGVLMERRAVRQTEVLLVSDQPEVTLSLKYFFTVVFRQNAYIARDVAEADGILRIGEAPKMIVVAEPLLDAASRSLFSQFRFLSPKPFCLVIVDNAGADHALRLFEAGADEVLRFPIALKELAYRLRLRSDTIGLSYEFDAAQGKRLGIASDIVQHAELTKFEAQVMHVLMMRHGEIVSRDDLSRAIDNTSWSYGDRKFDVHVGRIRRKLQSAFCGEVIVRTVHSVGYKLDWLPDEGHGQRS